MSMNQDDASDEVRATLNRFRVYSGSANEVVDALNRWMDARLRPATVAPAASPATRDARAEVGAVVAAAVFGTEWVVLGHGSVRRIDSDKSRATQMACSDDVFVRWATREECERHGIPYVERTAPVDAPAKPAVDRDGLIAFIRRERINWEGNSDTRKIDEVSADAALAFLKAKGVGS